MIFVTGDCHGDFSRFENERFNNLTKDDYVIICGDFGGIWDNKKSRWEKKTLKKLDKMKFTTLFVDGNHENFDRLYDFPIMEWHGGKVHKISKSVFHLMRGEIFELDGKIIFAFGGAQCHDIKNGVLNKDDYFKIQEYENQNKGFRIRGYDWWDLELPTNEEMSNGVKNLEKYNYIVDYVISHCAPTSIQNVYNEYYPVNRLTEFLEEVKDNTKFKKWYLGHYHMNDDKTLKEFECLYENIIEVK